MASFIHTIIRHYVQLAAVDEGEGCVCGCGCEYVGGCMYVQVREYKLGLLVCVHACACVRACVYVCMLRWGACFADVVMATAIVIPSRLLLCVPKATNLISQSRPQNSGNYVNKGTSMTSQRCLIAS